MGRRQPEGVVNMGNKPIDIDKITDGVKVRFWSKVKKTDGCWLWVGGARNPAGYGQFKFNGKQIAAHRFSYAVTHNDDPQGFVICHHCDNPQCVNPDHIYKGTATDNAADRENRGRSNRPVGENRSDTKLTNAQVLRMRELYSNGEQSIYGLSSKFGVVAQNVHEIVTGKLYKSVGGPIATGKVRKPKGEKNPKAKLTMETVRQIRQAHSQGKNPKELAALYSISDCTIRDIVKNRTWKEG